METRYFAYAVVTLIAGLILIGVSISRGGQIALLLAGLVSTGAGIIMLLIEWRRHR